MPHRLIVPTNADGARHIFDFVLESEGRNGWVTLRLIRFEEDPPTGIIPAELQDERIGSLGSLFKARRIHLDGVTRYSVVNAFGLRGYTQLDYIPDIV
jgi:hypothetical protein